MGFWDWLAGKKSNVTTMDRIWLNKPAKWRGIACELHEHIANNQPTLVLAHFPATLTELEQELNQQSVPYQLFQQKLNIHELVRQAIPTLAVPAVRLGLVRNLDPDPFPDQQPLQPGSIQLLVVERHFVNKFDENVEKYAQGIPRRCQVVYHLSLQDPLLNAVTGEWVHSILQHLGMDEFTPLESDMLSKNIRQAQEKFKLAAEDVDHSHSAEDWLLSHGYGKKT
ncbi:MAG TPA: hypothetical protein PKD72_10900 [Gemmatales bacterium]|nr:hypothetical protein [Gemmatales bacterium]